ncbi:MAG: hypothetical protein SFV22_00560 [Saprospiraceae bacterium]|nr:hypothetical protein [Saprospiraceae bacterium]
MDKASYGSPTMGSGKLSQSFWLFARGAGETRKTLHTAQTVKGKFSFASANKFEIFQGGRINLAFRWAICFFGLTKVRFFLLEINDNFQNLPENFFLNFLFKNLIFNNF